MPTVTGILETALHVEDVQRALAFYQSLFGFEVLGSDDRFAALSVAGRQVLLLFRRGGATVPLQLPGGVIPPHDSHGPGQDSLFHRALSFASFCPGCRTCLSRYVIAFTGTSLRICT